MAMLDNESNTILVRIVYAGPPLSGKTQSIRSLAGMLLGRRADEATFSPGEAQGRTLYFDWVDYVGGLFKGRQVRCQIVSVPGQSALAERRRLILETADAVIFVVDSHPEKVAAADDYFREVRLWTDGPERGSPGASWCRRTNVISPMRCQRRRSSARLVTILTSA